MGPYYPTFVKSSSIGGLGVGVGVGSNVNINFCFSCSYRGNAVTMKNMLETAFPGIDVILANHPPPLPKGLLSKVVPVAQFGIIGIIMPGEQIFQASSSGAVRWPNRKGRGQRTSCQEAKGCLLTLSHLLEGSAALLSGGINRKEKRR
ncbi:SELT-like protein precursor [Tripterygium wilfordii]|uniref:SELT-like protein n=1 Tax=Tripterygium wilfordii TaxID=458696 RepID=A0A7J7DX11_TRIWF|nr:SELT-like protein precursor [Tripterygium wilfordii]